MGATVEPIRDPTKIIWIKERLRARNRRNYLLFVWGINTALRVSDLLSIRLSQVWRDGPLPSFVIREKKTAHERHIAINDAMAEALRFYMATHQPKHPDEPLFMGRGGQPLSRSMVEKLIKKWCREAGLFGRYGTHTFRKTWGYMARTQHGISWEQIAMRLGHSSPASTMRYLGITQDEIHKLEREINL